MYQYIARRLILTIPVVLGVSIIVFAIIRMLPGDPARAMAGPQASPQYIASVRARYGLDQPIPMQYVTFMSRAVQGDLGVSVFSRRPVLTEIGERFPRTLLLASVSLLLATAIGVPAGIISATKRNSLFDNASMIAALVGVAAPVFWLALMLQLLFAVQLGWFPSSGIGTAAHLVLPAVTLGAASAGLFARITRSSMLEVLREDYVTTARAKGLAENVVVYKHALKSAMIPVVTVLGLQFGILLGGAVLTETVFAWPGIGRLLVDSILRRDYPVVQATVMMLALLFVIINLVVDIAYAFLDPRIQYQGGQSE